MDFLRLFSFNPDQFSDPSLLSSLGRHREAGGGERARVPGQNYTVQTVLVQPVPLPAGSSSSQIPWLGPSKSLEPRARGSRSPALGQEPASLSSSSGRSARRAARGWQPAPELGQGESHHKLMGAHELHPESEVSSTARLRAAGMPGMVLPPGSCWLQGTASSGKRRGTDTTAGFSPGPSERCG